MRHELQDVHAAVQTSGDPRQGAAGQLHAREGEPGRELVRPQDPPQALLPRQAQLLHPLQEEPPSPGRAGRQARLRPLRGGGGGGCGGSRSWSPWLQPMWEAIQSRLKPGAAPADPPGSGRRRAREAAAAPEAASHQDRTPRRQDQDLHLRSLQQDLHALVQLLPPQEGSPGGGAAGARRRRQTPEESRVRRDRAPGVRL